MIANTAVLFVSLKICRYIYKIVNSNSVILQVDGESSKPLEKAVIRAESGWCGGEGRTK